MANIKQPYNPQNEVPDATGISGERVNSWKLFMEDELAKEKYEDEEEDD